MHRSKLKKNRFNNNPTEENSTLYKKQRNFCVNLLRKEKKKYYNNLNVKIFNDNKAFWKGIKPLFSDKQAITQTNIVVVDKDGVTSDNFKVAQKLNDFFTDAVDNLGIEPFYPQACLGEYTQPENGIKEIIRKYNTHPSIVKIKENVDMNEKFNFRDISSNEIKTYIHKIDTTKASIENDFPAKILIGSSEISSDYLSAIYNDSVRDNCYPLLLKRATIIPIEKAGTKDINYRPVSLIPLISKLFERHMYEEIIPYVEKYLSTYLFGFRRGHSSEQMLTCYGRNMEKGPWQQKVAGVVLTDLSKAFDCINHELLIAKLEAYGFDEGALNFINSYLLERNQRTKVNRSYSSRQEVKFGVPQGSILAPLLFNIFINDIFYFIDKAKLANYADGTTVYTTEESRERLLTILSSETTEVLNWFRFNEMQSNDDKCNLFIPNTSNVCINLGNEVIETVDSVDLLGVEIDKGLTFKDHVLKLCKKGNQKLHALARVAKYLKPDKLRIIMKTFIESQFNYCPLIWMFHSRTLNNKINRLHERALRIVYRNDALTFKELLQLDDSVHERNLQRLATEMFKVKRQLCLEPIQKLFPLQTASYDFRNKRQWEVANVKTVSYGTETIRYRGPKTWELLPAEIKE